MSLKKISQGSMVALILVLGIPVIALAGSKQDAKAVVTTSFQLVGGEVLNGTTLEQGEYTVIAREAEVSFVRNGKVVAQAPIQWKDLGKKARQNTLLSEAGSIQEIQFGGKTESAVVRE